MAKSLFFPLKMLVKLVKNVSLSSEICPENSFSSKICPKNSHKALNLSTFRVVCCVVCKWAVKRHQRAQNIRSLKALLLVENCSAHPQELKTRDGSVTCMFLPPNTTSLIQSMNQGVLQAMKNCYKRKLLQKMICSEDLDPTQNIKEIVKQHTGKDALYMLPDASEKRCADSIFKAYSKLQIHPDVWPNVSEPEPENISTEPIMDILNQAANCEDLSSSDVKD